VGHTDDTYVYLLVPAFLRSSIPLELDDISRRAIENNLRFNASKSPELIHRRSGFVSPPPLIDATRVSSLSVIGVLLRDDLDAHDHVNLVLVSCSRSLYALRTVRSCGYIYLLLLCKRR